MWKVFWIWRLNTWSFIGKTKRKITRQQPLFCYVYRNPIQTARSGILNVRLFPEPVDPTIKTSRPPVYTCTTLRWFILFIASHTFVFLTFLWPSSPWERTKWKWCYKMWHSLVGYRAVTPPTRKQFGKNWNAAGEKSRFSAWLPNHWKQALRKSTNTVEDTEMLFVLIVAFL